MLSPILMESMILRHRVSRALGSWRAVIRSVWSSRCSSLSATCWVLNSMSTRFLPRAPDSDFFRSVRYISDSSWDISPREASIQEMTSRLLFT